MNYISCRHFYPDDKYPQGHLYILLLRLCSRPANFLSQQTFVLKRWKDAEGGELVRPPGSSYILHDPPGELLDPRHLLQRTRTRKSVNTWRNARGCWCPHTFPNFPDLHSQPLWGAMKKRKKTPQNLILRKQSFQTIKTRPGDLVGAGPNWVTFWSKFGLF